MNTTQGDWYLLETNYDHWKAPLFIDDRRTPVSFSSHQHEEVHTKTFFKSEYLHGIRFFENSVIFLGNKALSFHFR